MAILNIIRDEYYLSYEKSLNFDNSKLYIQNCNGKHLPFQLYLGFVAVSVTFSLEDKVNGTSYSLNSNLITISGNSISFNNSNDLPTLVKSNYYYKLIIDGTTYKSELFYNCNIVTINEVNQWLFSTGILNVIKDSDKWSFEKSLNFDNSKLYTHLTRSEWLPVNFDVTTFDVGNLLEFNLVNYVTGEKTNIGIEYIENSGAKYWFSGNITFNNPDGCYYYELIFDNVTLKSEIFKNVNPLYFEGDYITTDEGNIITDEMNNKIEYI